MRKRVNFMRNAVMYVLVALFMLVSAFALIHAVGFHDAEPRVSSEAAETVLTPAQKAQFFTPYYEEATVYLTDPRGKSLSIYRVNEYGGTVILDQWSSGGTANMLGYKVKNGGYMVVYAPYGTAVSSGAIMQCSSSSTAITLLTNITDGRIVVNSARYQNLYVDNDGYIYMKAYNAVSTTSAQLKEWSKAYFTKDGAVSWHSSSSDCLNINMSTGGGTGGSGGTGGGSSGLTPQSALAMAGIDGNHLPYTGQEHNFTTENTWVKLAKTLGGSSVIFAGDTNKTNAGTYTLVALLGGGDYKMVTWYIDKADPVAETYQQTVETTPGQEISADTLLKFTSPFDPTKDGGKFTITVEPSGSKAVSVTGSGDLSALKLTGGSETGTATVKISYAGGTNLNGKTWSFRVTNSLSSEIYTGTGDAKTTYPTLEEAVKAVEAGTAAGPIYVNGTVEVGSPIAVSKDITITQGDKADMPAELKLTASAGSMFEVQGGGVLTLQAVAAKGVPQNPTSLVSLTGGALTLENVSVESFGNSAVAANGAGAKITLAGENTFASCGASAAKAQNGGAISLTGGAVLTAAEEGASVTFNGCMAAENGGAIYAEEATVEAANLAITATGCSAATGGAIYLGSGTTAGIHESTYIENNSAAKANGVYVADGSTLTLPTAANDINDGIMLGYTASDEKNASIVLSGEAPEAGKTIIVEFEDPANQVEDFSKYITSEGNALSAADMKGFMRVKNAGYTFDPNAADGSLHLRPTSDNVAAYYDGTKWVPCASLQAAIDAVAATSTSEDPGKVALYQYRNTQTEGGQIYGGDLEILEKLTIPAGAHITLGSITGTVSESGGNAEYDEEVDPFTLKRGTSLTDEMIKVEKGASLTLTNVILDGGAVWNKDKPETPAYSDWTAQAGKVKIADDGNGGAGTVETNNTGVVAHAPVIVNQGTLNIGEGATIQNNDNNWAMPGVGFGSQNYGGGVRNGQERGKRRRADCE